MTYYKIVKNNLIIDVNSMFFRYQRKRMNLVPCDENKAELVQSSDGKTFYTTEWLKPLPEGVHHEFVDVIPISKEEYLKLREELQLNEAIPQPTIIEEEIKSEPMIIDEEPQKIQKVVNIRELYEEIRQLKEELKSLKK